MKHSHSDSHEPKTLHDALEVLEKSSLRKTKHREALLKILLENHGPFSVEELRQFVGNDILDLVTVYRCLTAFESIGLVRRCDFGDGIARYEIQLDDHHHHHVICTLCRKSENIIEDCEIHRLEKLVEQKGYSKISHNLEFFGICPKCKVKASLDEIV
jgi:Fur family ferric uptake transcriptional regulator